MIVNNNNYITFNRNLTKTLDSSTISKRRFWLWINFHVMQWIVPKTGFFIAANRAVPHWRSAGHWSNEFVQPPLHALTPGNWNPPQLNLWDGIFMCNLRKIVSAHARACVCACVYVYLVREVGKLTLRSLDIQCRLCAAKLERNSPLLKFTKKAW